MPDEKPKSIKFHYLKSSHFRVVHVDGIFGGLSPRGEVTFALYSERFAIPQQTEQVLNPDGSLGKDVPEGRVGRDGVVRELEVEAVMTTETARGLRDWLTEQLKTFDQLTAQAGEHK
jgi:hypothetical protein